MNDRSIVTADAPVQRPGWTRRSLLRASFWAGFGAVLASAAAGVINTLYPRGVTGFGGPIVVPASAIPKPGDAPKAFPLGRFWLVNLATNEGRIAGDDSPARGGLVALYRKCPHLGCSVPWRNEVVTPHDDLRRQGWFLCPCHASTYTRAGVRVFGPAPRSMDTMAIDLADDGSIVVDTGDIKEGAADNPHRAVQWTTPAPVELSPAPHAPHTDVDAL